MLRARSNRRAPEEAGHSGVLVLALPTLGFLMTVGSPSAESLVDPSPTAATSTVERQLS